VLQEALETELDMQLGYNKHDVKNKQTKNSRNGFSKKTMTSEYGV
jgi:putative transposase